MRRWTIFSLATLCWLGAPTLIPPQAAVVMAGIACCGLLIVRSRTLSAGLLGIAWLPCYFYWIAGGVWLTRLPSPPADIDGVILTLGQYARPSFDFRVLSIDGVVLPAWQHLTVRCHWYDSPPIARGQRWRLRVRLRPIRSTANPGAFNYQRWSLSRSVLLKGRVLQGSPQFPAAEITSASIYQRWFDRWYRLTEPLRYAGVVRALTFGVRQDLQPDDRQRFVTLGIAHLLAISGLHIGLLAAVGLLLGRICANLPWLRRVAHLREPLAVTLALLLATGYAWQAGFSSSSCRALAMVVLFFVGRLLLRRYGVANLLAMAVAGLLLVNPLQILDAGLWLSVTAVAAIAVVHWRCRHWWSHGSRWQRRLKLALVVQLGLLLLMLPLQWFWFGGISLVAPLANLIAIPYVSLLVVPLVLLAQVLAFVPYLATGLLMLVDLLLAWLLAILEPLSRVEYGFWSVPSEAVGALMGGLLALLACCLPLPRPRRLAIVGVCLLVAAAATLPDGRPRWRIRVLDVGQGLSVLVEQGREALVYDTGARFPSGFTYANSVITPVLRHDGIRRLDALILSHRDNDHAGGWESLWREWTPARLIAGAPLPLAYQPCRAGQQYRWRELEVRILAPFPGVPGLSSNNGSCVVRVGDGDFGLLLTGDIEWEGERRLVAAHPAPSLAATWLLSPHHGSKSSSTTELIEAVAPQLVIHSAGYLNPYHFPHDSVVERYQRLGIRQWNTAVSGAITIDVYARNWRIRGQRHVPWRLWYQQFPDGL